MPVSKNKRKSGKKVGKQKALSFKSRQTSDRKEFNKRRKELSDRLKSALSVDGDEKVRELLKELENEVDV